MPVFLDAAESSGRPAVPPPRMRRVVFVAVLSLELFPDGCSLQDPSEPQSRTVRRQCAFSAKRSARCRCAGALLKDAAGLRCLCP